MPPSQTILLMIYHIPYLSPFKLIPQSTQLRLRIHTPHDDLRHQRNPINTPRQPRKAKPDRLPPSKHQPQPRQHGAQDKIEVREIRPNGPMIRNPSLRHTIRVPGCFGLCVLVRVRIQRVQDRDAGAPRGERVCEVGGGEEGGDAEEGEEGGLRPEERGEVGDGAEEGEGEEELCVLGVAGRVFEDEGAD